VKIYHLATLKLNAKHSIYLILFLLQAASDTLSLILGEDVTIVDVKRHVASQRRHVQATRRSEGGSAFYSRHPHHPHS
jgi:hypothetical protein